MSKKLAEFYRSSLQNFFEAIFNYLVFLPYLFSVKNLLKTLFSPWKNLVKKKVSVGLNIGETLNCWFFNLVSRTLGFCMRSAILFFYLIVQTLYVILLPMLIISYLLITPFLFIISLTQPTEIEQKIIAQETFLKQHLLKEENRQSVLAWFEEFYLQKKHSQQWWKLTNLLLIPPLARDWAVGYTPILNDYCEDLTAPEYQNKLIDTVTRQQEINSIENALLKSEAGNLLIVGDAGVGKHTLVDNLAKKIYLGNTHSALVYKRILKINLERVMNKYVDQKQKETFFEELLKEAEMANNIILLINNFEKYVDLLNSLEKFAKSTKLHIIGITTPFAYQKFLFNDEKIGRYFTKVDVFEVDKKQAEKILLNKVLYFEKNKQVFIPYETVKVIIEKSDYYITSIPFPEKAIIILDAACVYVKNTLKQLVIKPEYIDQVITQITHAPTLITDEMKTKLNQIEAILKTQIIGQEQAIIKTTATLKRAFISLGKRKKSLATFLFIGPTGVGKTQTAKIISQVIFGKDKELLRFDMANYQNKKDIGNLIGSLDSPNPGLLTQAIRENPFSVLLLDEIEKADKDVINIFLALLDEGYFTDGFGKHVDGKNLIIIATSNATSTLQFQDETVSETQLINFLVQKNYFSPEFLNRFDGIIFFQKLDPDIIKTIVEKTVLEIVKEIYNNHQVKLNISAEFLEQLLTKNYSQEFGARNLERVVREKIGNQVANLILENKAKAGDTITI